MATTSENVGELLFKKDYQAACLLLNGLSMSELITVLDSLYVTYPLSPLINYTAQAATAVNRARLLAAMYAVTGAPESRIVALLMQLPADQQKEVRNRVAAGQGASGSGGLQIPGLYPEPTSPPPGSPGLAPLPSESELVESIKKAFKTATDGVSATRGPASLNLSVKGLTASLRGAGAKAELNASPFGSISLTTSYRGGNFQATLSAERWDMQLTFSLTDPIPNRAQLGKIFGEGEEALRKAAGEVSKFSKLEDVPRIKEAIKPHTQPIKEAIDAAIGAHGASEAKRYRPIPGITASGPAPGATPGAPGAPGATRIQATITIFF